MSKRSLALLVLLATVCLAVCGGALVVRFWRGAALGPLPAEALDLPAATGLLAGLNVPSAMTSPAWQHLTGEGAPLRETLRALERETGLALERDVTHVVVALDARASVRPVSLVVVLGSFRSPRVLEALSLSAPGRTPTVRAASGAALYVVAEDTSEAFAFASPKDGLLVAGKPALVEAFLADRTRRPLASNKRLAGLLRSVTPGASLWLVADQEALGRTFAGHGRTPTPVPPPRALTLAVGPDGALELAAEMADAATAERAAQTLQGFLALARLEGSRRAAPDGTDSLPESLERVMIRADGQLTRARLPLAATRALATLAAARLARTFGVGPEPGAAPAR